MPNTHECNACGHIYDKDMYEVCPECQRHPDDDQEEDLFGLMCEHRDDDTEDAENKSGDYGRTIGFITVGALKKLASILD